MKQKNGQNGYDNTVSGNTAFFFPIRRKLPQKIHFHCRCCGEKYYEEYATEYCWPDRAENNNRGYVVVCRSCGCRQQIPMQTESTSVRKVTPPLPAVGPREGNRPKRLPIVAILAALIMMGGGMGLFINMMSSSQPPAPEKNNAEMKNTSETTDSVPSSDTKDSHETTDSENVSEGNNDNTYDALPDTINVGNWDSDRHLQGLDWDTDNKNLDIFFISDSHYVGSYNLKGERINRCNKVKGYLYSVDYYDGMVFSMMRPSGNGKFKLRIYDSKSMVLLKSIKLPDIQEAFSADKERFGSEIKPSFYAVSVAPEAGGGNRMKIYISYNVCRNSKDGTTLHQKERIYEYDYEEAIGIQKTLYATNTYEFNFGEIEYGIQTLEYDSSTGQMWCAVRQGRTDYSLYCINWNTLDFVKNGDKDGWNCPYAGDGFCCLGNDTFYVLVPSYKDGYSSANIVKAHSEDLENIEVG